MAKEYFAHSRLLPFYIEWQTKPTNANYNLSFYYTLKTQHETNVLVENLQKIIALSPPLRQTFDIKKKRLIATIHDELPANIHFFNANAEDFPALLNNLAKMPHDLNHRSSISLNIIKLHEHYIVLFNIHHIIMDGLALDTFILNLNKLTANEPIDIISAEQYIAAIKNEDSPPCKLNQKQKYYTAKINRASEEIVYPKANNTACYHYKETMTMALYQKLVAFSELHSISIFNLLLVINQLFISKLFNQKQTIVDYPVNIRKNKSIDGCFVHLTSFQKE